MGNSSSSDVQSFGGWVQSRRQAMNLTRAELAKEAGCAAVTIKKIERDERKPSRQMAEILAMHLAIPRMDRKKFMQMARSNYDEATGPAESLLRIPAFLQQDERSPDSLKGNFVERRKELSRLETCLHLALAGNAMPVFLLGDAGSGKTSLMREFARIAQEAHPDLLVAGGQCNAQTGPGDPFRPFRDMLGILTGDLEIDLTIGMLNREQALRIWAAIPDVIRSITASGPHLMDILLPIQPLAHRLAPYLGRNTDWFDQFQVSAEAAASVQTGLEQGQVLEELTQVFRTLAGQHPLLLILDDLQWADDASLNFLFHLGRRLTGSRILLLGAYRSGESIPGRQAGPQDSAGAQSLENILLELARQYGDNQVNLNQAGSSEGKAFIDAILDLEPNRLGEAFRENLYLHTHGHPLFTVEMLRSMRQNQNIVLDASGTWVENKSSAPAPRPARIEAVIEQRLARLEPQLRELLNIASVEGEGFTAELVATLLGLDKETVLKSLTRDLGQHRHLIQEQGQIHVRNLDLNRFQFQHMLIQEYLYSQLMPGEKRRLHRRMAEELEKNLIGPEDGLRPEQGTKARSEEMAPAEYLDAFGPALLHHFWLGEVWPKASVYADHLGKRARQRYAMREAIAYYEQALLSLDNQAGAHAEATFDVLLDWEEAAFNFRPYQEQLKQLSRAEEIARGLHDKPRLVQALQWSANVLLARGLWTQAGPALTESFSLAEELGEERLSVLPTYFKALMTTFADPSEALKWIDRAEGLSRKYSDFYTEALALATKGQVLAQLGGFESSRQAIELARQVSDRLASPILESDVDLFAAWANLTMGNKERALEYGQTSVERAIATDNMDCICNGLTCIGYTNLELGRIPEAASAFERAIERSDTSGAMIPKLNAQAGLAMTQFLSGHPDAIEVLEEAVINMRLIENHVGAANANHLLGTCLIQLGDLERASSNLNQAVDFYRRSQMHPFLARALRSLGELKEKQGLHSESQEFREEAESFQSIARNSD